jgi:hypothetical protein
VILNNLKNGEDKKETLINIKSILINKYNYSIEPGTLEEYLILLKQLNFLEGNIRNEISDIGRQFLTVSQNNSDLNLSEPERQFLLRSLFKLEQVRQFLSLFCDRKEVINLDDFRLKAKPTNTNESLAIQIGVNWKTFRVIRGWVEQINLIEYNDAKEVYNPIIHEQVDEKTFIKFLTTEYTRIKGNKYKQRITLNEIRNEICLTYGIRKEKFDKLLLDVWSRIPEKICLERASGITGKLGLETNSRIYYYITLRNLNGGL